MIEVAAPIDVEAFQNAIHAWLSTVTGLETIWREQSAPQPKYPYGALLVISGPEALAPQFEQRRDTDLNRDEGEEVRLTECVPCRFTVSCQAYVGMPEANNPQGNALHYMNKARGSLALESVRAEIWAAGIAIERPGPVQNIGEVIEDAFVSRANMDVAFAASLSIEEYTGYIAKVELESGGLELDFDVELGP